MRRSIHYFNPLVSFSHTWICSDKREAVDITLADFDGVQYHIATNATQRNLVTVSISWPCISQMKQFGTDAKVQSFYGSLVTSAETGYDYTLQFDLDNLADKGNPLAHCPPICSSPLEAFHSLILL